MKETINKCLYLFVDESGLPAPDSPPSDVYILCGCSVDQEERKKLEIEADQIKFKYWGHTDVIFHSYEIARNSGTFAIFKSNPQLKKEFEKDLLKYLRNTSITIFSVIVDKDDAKNKRWNKTKVLKETSNKLIGNFIKFVCSKPKMHGKIVVESSSEKNPYYLRSFDGYLSNGISSLSISHNDVKERVTEISFVTKGNHDIETQIADLLSYGAKCKYDLKKYNTKYSVNSYESKILKIFERKSFRMDPATKGKKKKLLKGIKSYDLIP